MAYARTHVHHILGLAGQSVAPPGFGRIRWKKGSTDSYQSGKCSTNKIPLVNNRGDFCDWVTSQLGVGKLRRCQAGKGSFPCSSELTMVGIGKNVSVVLLSLKAVNSFYNRLPNKY